MWTQRGRLPHVLSPRAYVSAEQHQRERERVFGPAWHAVAVGAELASPGAFVSRRLLDTRVLLERREGVITACEDRAPPGRGADRRETDRGRAFRVARRGELVFVNLLDDSPPLEAQLDPATIALLSRVFPADLPLAAEITLEHPCNWKIPLENVLETYHVPALHTNWLARHPEVFRFFTPRRDGRAEVHALGPRHTSFHAAMGGESRLYQAFLRLAHPTASVDYVHHHAFPNLVVGHTAFVSFLQIVEPLSATRCRNTIRLFLDIGGRRARRLGNAVSPAIDRAAQALLRVILSEDAAVYADHQRGLAVSTQPGVLGANEERVHAFQRWVAERVSEIGGVGAARDGESAGPKSG